MKRRDLIAMIGGAALGWPLRALPQPASDLPLVAVLWPSSPDAEAEFDVALRTGLKDGGFVEGTNFAIAARYANGSFDRFLSLAAELVALKPSVMVTATDPAALAMHAAAPTVALVIANMASDPVALGLAKSYARPGGTVTGSTLTAGGDQEGIAGKRVGLLKEFVPGLTRIGFIATATSPEFIAAQTAGAAAAADLLGLTVLTLRARTLEDIEAAFASGLRDGAEAFYVDGTVLTFTHRARVAELGVHAGKPTLGSTPGQARAGLLMSYGSDFGDPWRRAGTYAAKILTGVKPGDLPIWQESKVPLVINLRTAKALGLTIPPTLLARADEVIE